MAYIGKTPVVGNFQICDAISVVNGQAAYTLQVGGANVIPESANHMIVSLSGVIQKPGSSYTVSGSTITFSQNLVTGDVIDFIQILGNVLDIGTPSDATVTTAKLGDSAVTTAKLGDGSVTSAKLASGAGGVTGITSNATSNAITISSDERVTIDADDEKALVVHHNDGNIVRIGMNNNATNSNEIGFDSSDFIVKPGGTERMRVNSDGALLIGNPSYLGTLNVKGAGWITSSETTAGTNSSLVYFSKRSSNGIQMRFQQSSTTCGDITTSGSSVSYGSNSDYRLKENVVEMTNATTRLKQLQPKRFNFIADADTTVDGFLAHEVQTVVPEAITGTKDAVDEDGNPEYQGIDQAKLVPLLVKTIQELEARITALESE